MDSKRLDAVKRELRELNDEIEALDQSGAEIPGGLRQKKRGLEKELRELGERGA